MNGMIRLKAMLVLLPVLLANPSQSSLPDSSGDKINQIDLVLTQTAAPAARVRSRRSTPPERRSVPRTTGMPPFASEFVI